MKNILPFLLGITLLGCGGDTTTAEGYETNNPSVEVEQRTTEGAELLAALEGTSRICRKDEEGYYRHNTCSDYLPLVSFDRYQEDPELWSASMELAHVYTYDILRVREEGNRLSMVITDQMNIEGEPGEATWVLQKDENGTWELIEPEHYEGSFLIPRGDAEALPEVPCNDIEEICSIIPLGWTPLVEMGPGSWGFYEECHYGTGGVTIDDDGNMIHFSGGGDGVSYNILRMELEDDIVTITYSDHMTAEQGELIIENVQDKRSTFIGESGWLISEWYVSDVFTNEWPTEEEPCEE